MIPPYHWWRTVFFLIPAIGVYTVVLGSISIASSLVDSSGDFGHRCARAWAWLVLRTTGVGVTAHGIERLDRGRSYVFASNHQSIYDIPIVFATVPLQLRIVAKDSLGNVPFLGWHLRRTGHLLVDQEKSRCGGRQENGSAGSSGPVRSSCSRKALVAPTGRSRAFKGGMFLVAIDAGLPVVPVSIAGSRHVMLKGRLMTCPGEVTITFHDPIPTAGVDRAGARALADRVAEVVQGAVDEPQKHAIIDRLTLSTSASPVHVTAIIAAGGTGRRIGAAVPKQLLEVEGRSLLERSIDAFRKHPSHHRRDRCVAGGSRQQSSRLARRRPDRRGRRAAAGFGGQRVRGARWQQRDRSGARRCTAVRDAGGHLPRD